MALMQARQWTPFKRRPGSMRHSPGLPPGRRIRQQVFKLIEGEATVKRYYPEGDRIRFQPANSNMAPIIVRRAEFKSVDIIGIVVGVYRKLS